MHRRRPSWCLRASKAHASGCGVLCKGGAAGGIAMQAGALCVAASLVRRSACHYGSRQRPGLRGGWWIPSLHSASRPVDCFTFARPSHLHPIAFQHFAPRLRVSRLGSASIRRKWHPKRSHVAAGRRCQSWLRGPRLWSPCCGAADEARPRRPRQSRRNGLRLTRKHSIRPSKARMSPTRAAAPPAPRPPPLRPRRRRRAARRSRRARRRSRRCPRRRSRR